MNLKKSKPVQVRSARLPTAPIPRPDTVMRLQKPGPALNYCPPYPLPRQPFQIKREVAIGQRLCLRLLYLLLRPAGPYKVGSYTRRVSAHKAAIRARRTAIEVLDLMPAELSLVSSGGLPLWRVRFGQLKEQEARSACAALLRRSGLYRPAPDPCRCRLISLSEIPALQAHHPACIPAFICLF